ncbi:MAG: glyceraldehyde 3-phosphate dehydrogenase NAD-binding domain-containing protein, partial [Lutibacter sp.]
MTYNKLYEKELEFQTNRRRAAVELIRIISDLWYDNTVELVLFRNQLLDRNVSEILNLIEYASDFVEKPISIFDAVKIANEIKSQSLAPAKIDLGKLVYEFHLEDLELKDFVSSKLLEANNNEDITPKDVVLFGFGRIGRLLARELMNKMGKGKMLRLRAIVVRGELTKSVLEKRASLLKYDSVHGDFHGSVSVNEENNSLIINGTTVHIISSKNPEDMNYKDYGINDALLIDNTGAFRDKISLSRHLEAPGISKVILTAPGKEIPNIVYGVNHFEYDPEETNIFSAASCTTNAITPVLKVMEDNFGVINGHLETIHA